MITIEEIRIVEAAFNRTAEMSCPLDGFSIHSPAEDDEYDLLEDVIDGEGTMTLSVFRKAEEHYPNVELYIDDECQFKVILALSAEHDTTYNYNQKTIEKIFEVFKLEVENMND